MQLSDDLIVSWGKLSSLEILAEHLKVSSLFRYDEDRLPNFVVLVYSILSIIQHFKIFAKNVDFSLDIDTMG